MKLWHQCSVHIKPSRSEEVPFVQHSHPKLRPHWQKLKAHLMPSPKKYTSQRLTSFPFPYVPEHFKLSFLEIQSTTQAKRNQPFSRNWIMLQNKNEYFYSSPILSSLFFFCVFFFCFLFIGFDTNPKNNSNNHIPLGNIFTKIRSIAWKQFNSFSKSTIPICKVYVFPFLLFPLQFTRYHRRTTVILRTTKYNIFVRPWPSWRSYSNSFVSDAFFRRNSPSMYIEVNSSTLGFRVATSLAR